MGLSRLSQVLHPFLHGDQSEKQLDAELRFDYDQRVAKHILSGMSEAEAQRAARLEFGSIDQVKEECREARNFWFLHSLLQDIRYGVRTLFHSPGFTIAAVLSLALGIGSNTVIFSLLNTTLLRPLDYKDPARLVAIWTVPRDHAADLRLSNVASYLAWRKGAKSFESMGSFFQFEGSAARDENGAPAERITGQYVSSSLFGMLGVGPALGRTFTEKEGAPITYSHVVVISDRLWERRYARDPHILDKTLELDGVKNRIVGVMPKNFTIFQDNADYWAPSGITRQRLESSDGRIAVVGRLRDGVGMEQAQAEMDGLAAYLSREDPARYHGNGARVKPLQESFVGTFRSPLLLLQGAVVFVLLIACANVAGLLLARGASRQTEVAVRAAVGAGRRRIVRQLLTESAVLAAVGGIFGVALAWGGLRLFIATVPAGFPRLNELSLDFRVLAFTAAIALMTGIIFGLVPAMQLSRTDLIEGLKTASRGAATAFVRQRFRTSLVTMQVALALMLLIGAGLMINSFLRIQANELGMDPRGVLEFQFRYPALQVMKAVGKYRNNGIYDVSPRVDATTEAIVERLRHVPGVTSAAALSEWVGGAVEMNFHVDGEVSKGVAAPLPEALYLGVTPSYFATLRTPVLRGRDFKSCDTAAGKRVAIVSESLARRYWPGRDPIGRRITIDYLPNDQPREIVGVVGDVRLSRTQQEARPMMYVPLFQQGPQWMGPQLGARAGAYFVLRSAADPVALTAAARRAVAEIDPSQPIANIQTVEEAFSGQVEFTRFYMLLLGVFGATAAILAAVGIHGVMSFSIAQRKREIGIRMALGANQSAVRRLVGRQAATIIGLGLLLGLTGSLVLTRVLESSLWNVTPTDPATFLAVSVFLALIGVVACLVPTRQATRVDPAAAVRVE